MSPTISKASSEERRSQSSVDESEIQRAQSRCSRREGAVNRLDHVQSHVSHHDMVANDDFQEVDAEQYLRFSPARKLIIVGVLSFCSFLAPISSTSILAAMPEVAKTYNTTGSVINASNALYMAFMGIAAPFWGPFSQVWGRRPVGNERKSILK
jgi:Arabinose efflux permease